MAAINTRIAGNCSPICSYKQGVHDAVDKNIGPPTHYTYSSWPAMETQQGDLPVHSFCVDVNARGVSELCSYWVRSGLASVTHHVPQHSRLHCVTLQGLTLCGWLAVVTKHFNFARVLSVSVSSSLTVYGGMSRREDIFSADLLGILSQSSCHRSCAWFYTTVAMKLKKTQIQRLRNVERFCPSLGTMKTTQKVYKLWFL